VTSRAAVPRLHVVTDDRVLAGDRFGERARGVIEAGRGRIAFHLRGPGATGRRLWELGIELLPAAREHQVPLLVNDRIDLALALGASGVHLGSRSLPPEATRSILGPGFLLGRSAHDTTEVRELAPDVDYLHVGTVFPTPSHPGRSGHGVSGFRVLLEGAGETPVLALGGVTPDTAGALLRTGAHGIAVVRAVWGASEPVLAVRELLAGIEAAAGAGAAEGGTRVGREA